MVIMGVNGLDRVVGVTGPYELTVRSLRADCGRGTSDGDISGSGICSRESVENGPFAPDLLADPRVLAQLGRGETFSDNSSLAGRCAKIGGTWSVAQWVLSLDVTVETVVEVSVETVVNGSFELIGSPVDTGLIVSVERRLDVSFEIGLRVSVEIGLRTSLEAV